MSIYRKFEKGEIKELRGEPNYLNPTARREIANRARLSQGSILGPDFWNITIDRLLNHVETLAGEIFAYADDLILLVGGNSRRQLEERAQFYTDAINEWCVRNKGYNCPKQRRK